MDMFCVSQTATAICLSTDQSSPLSTPSSSPSAFLLTAGERPAVERGSAIDRHNPTIRDPKRVPKSLPPCTNNNTSQPTKSLKHHQKKTNKKIQFKENEDEKTEDGVSSNGFNGGVLKKKSWRCTNPGDFISPSGSARYLLSEGACSSDFGGKNLAVFEEINKDVKKTGGFLLDGKASPSHSPEQVVVLRVSLHCRGCERKLRKHLSRMEGVKSYNIEFEAKKVTITGNVSPLSVVTNISKVKNAQLW